MSACRCCSLALQLQFLYPARVVVAWPRLFLAKEAQICGSFGNRRLRTNRFLAAYHLIKEGQRLIVNGLNVRPPDLRSLF